MRCVPTWVLGGILLNAGAQSTHSVSRAHARADERDSEGQANGLLTEGRSTEALQGNAPGRAALSRLGYVGRPTPALHGARGPTLQGTDGPHANLVAGPPCGIRALPVRGLQLASPAGRRVVSMARSARPPVETESWRPPRIRHAYASWVDPCEGSAVGGQEASARLRTGSQATQ